jgi:Ca2+-binding EF-hand superfamily protein
MKAAFSSLKDVYSETELDDLMRTLDTNHSGFIDYTEFLAGCMRAKIYLKESNLKQAFEFFDADKSGFITFDELKKVLCGDGLRIPDKEIYHLISEVDANGDNKVDYNEFLKMMQKDLNL